MKIGIEKREIATIERNTQEGKIRETAYGVTSYKYDEQAQFPDGNSQAVQTYAAKVWIENLVRICEKSLELPEDGFKQVFNLPPDQQRAAIIEKMRGCLKEESIDLLIESNKVEAQKKQRR